MERKEQIRVLKEIIHRLDEGTTVDAGGIRHNPTWVYTCPDLAEKEWQTFYRDHPQVIGASSDLPGPGTFMTTHDFGTPVLATRNAKGVFHAFVNVCRHRGVMLEAETSGKRSRFSCPFHGWTYTNEGQLAGIPKPDHFGKIDRDCHGLIPLPAIERFGLLWVHPKPEGTIERDGPGYNVTLLGRRGAFGTDSQFGVVRDELIPMPGLPVVVETRPFVSWEFFRGFIANSGALILNWDPVEMVFSIDEHIRDVLDARVSVVQIDDVSEGLGEHPGSSEKRQGGRGFSDDEGAAKASFAARRSAPATGLAESGGR